MARQRRSAAVRRGAVLALLVVVVGIGTGWWLASQRRGPAPRPDVAAPAARTTPPASPHSTVRPVRPQPSPAPSPPAGRVAIVFDDAGGSLDDVEDIIAIGRPVTVAVLPGLAHSSEVARRASAAGLEVILHLPLEATDATKALGPGGITVDMDERQIREATLAGLASVPGAVGISNHMGSRGTAERRVMRAVLEVARARGLFFLDSRTTADSVVPSVAADLGVRTAVRTVFLDNTDEEEAIQREIQRLIATARRRGEAIAIGHAQRKTPRVVARMVGEFDRQGITLVPVSALVR
ncbi:MAG: divergent polysaccharide deacetylase family protein [Armatimonadota bacterium]|nr:divergent polysaccharide deacetylase family protein [Armatimonadota bacterium]MDR7519847.1 divergent polysaccharide deacetylase family protein [Armatimonadota bacterium]MDR7551070.1 divergent polysaccharide deacetylase family protein [Armatimonadota bacterium]